MSLLSRHSDILPQSFAAELLKIGLGGADLKDEEEHILHLMGLGHNEVVGSTFFQHLRDVSFKQPYPLSIAKRSTAFHRGYGSKNGKFFSDTIFTSVGTTRGQDSCCCCCDIFVTFSFFRRILS